MFVLDVPRGASGNCRMKQVYICSDGKTVEGPLAAEEVYNLVIQKKLASNTMVCVQGTDKWAPFEEITLSLMNLPDHIESISRLVEARDSFEQEQALLATTSAASIIGKAFAGSDGNLHSDMFGNIFSGHGHFAVGKLDHAPAYAGVLHSDEFGKVYSGDSHFPMGHTEKAPAHAGVLHNDTFGHIRSGDSPFPVGDLDHPHDHPF